MIETPLNPQTHSAEQAELDAVLASEAFRRAPTLARILEYLCERQLRGETFIKEYEIATQVMGRSRDFDPQQDGSVRVNLHHLRKKLKGFYEGEGASHAIWISLPIGQSLPSFVARAAEPIARGTEPPAAEQQSPVDPEINATTGEASDSPSWVAHSPIAAAAEPQPSPYERAPVPRLALFAACGAALVACLLAGFLMRPSAPKVPQAVISDATLRIAAGASHPFEDSAGRLWGRDADYHGGASFHRAVAAVGGAPGTSIYENGREGDFAYDLPLPRARYELHLYFAETAVHGEGFRTMGIWINGKQVEDRFDVTSDAGGFASATEKIYTGVEPGADGKLHLAFRGATGSAFLNGIEVLPGNGDAMRPIRQTTLPAYYFDPAGTVWTPDAWFHGGRTNHISALFPSLALPGFYSNERFGNFSYSIPVLPNRTYNLTLYFQDAWFSHEAKQPANLGERRFDVICNGQVLLRQFDVLGEAAKNAPAPRDGSDFRVVRHFSGIQPTTSGKIMLTFTPSENYAVLNALSIEQEPVAPPQ